MLRYLAISMGIVLLSAGALQASPKTESEGLSCPSYTQKSRGLPTSDEWRTYPSIADVNGDGHMDIAGSPRKARGPRVWLGSKNQRWRESSRGLSLPQGTACGVGTRLADVNGDGHLDLGVADHCNGLFLFFGNGKGQWRPGPQAVLTKAETGVEDLAFGDLDNDGDIDIVTSGSFDGGIEALINDGTGRFSFAEDPHLPAAGFAKSIALGDLNSDGSLDIVASYVGGTADRHAPVEFNLVWLAKHEDGKLRYEMNRTGLPLHRQPRMVQVADVNGDGHLDFAATFIPFRVGERLVRVFLGDGEGGWQESSESLPTLSEKDRVQYSGVALADLNGDGHGDLAALGSNTAQIYTWMGDGKGAWQACAAEETGLIPGAENLVSWGLRAADTNDDGKKDLVAAFGRVGKGGIEVWIAQ